VLARGSLAAFPSAPQAQGMTDRLELHGALNAACGRASELPVLGVPRKGTSDYRTLTLQGRYTLSENDQIVAQVFNRRLGASPLAGAISEVTMQWAYWQHNVLLSAEATPVARLKLETEHGKLTGHAPNNDNRSG
jgi:hypothetical protein